MKKLFALAFISLAAVTGTASSAKAWWPCFPLFDCCKGSCCSTTICLRQYNAFTPVCSGTLNCDGCCPLNLSCGYPGSGPAVMAPGCANGACYSPYGASVYAGGGYPMGQLPPAAMLSQPPMQGPVMGGMPVAPTAPVQVQPGQTSAAPQLLPFAGQVQPVGYRPMYYYGAAPYYWNNAR
jgi:hypothetical protein